VCLSVLEATFACFFILPSETTRLSMKEPVFEGSSMKESSIVTSHYFAMIINASVICVATLRFTGLESSTRMESARPTPASPSSVPRIAHWPASVAHRFAIATAFWKKSLSEMESAPPTYATWHTSLALGTPHRPMCCSSPYPM
jgi:hypothetical protein